MSVNGPARPPSRRGRVALVATAALALVVCTGFLAAGKARAHYRDVGLVMASSVPADVRAAQERTIAAHLEQHPDWAWMRETGGKVLCGVQELGERRAEPRNQSWVYVWADCRSDGGQMAHGEAGPRIVMLTEGRSPTVIFSPGDGSYYGAGIRSHFPRALWDTVFDAPDGIDAAALERQIETRRAGTK